MTNGSVDYKFGEICTELKDIHRRLDVNDEDHKALKIGLTELNVWRWKTIGAFGVLTVAFNLIVGVVMKYIN